MFICGVLAPELALSKAPVIEELLCNFLPLQSIWRGQVHDYTNLMEGGREERRKLLKSVESSERIAKVEKIEIYNPRLWRYPAEDIIIQRAWSGTHQASAAGGPSLLYGSWGRDPLPLNEPLQVFYELYVLHAGLRQGAHGETILRDPLLPTTIETQYLIAPADPVPFWLSPKLSLSLVHLRHMISVDGIEGKKPVSQLGEWELVNLQLIFFLNPAGLSVPEVNGQRCLPKNREQAHDNVPTEKQQVWSWKAQQMD